MIIDNLNVVGIARVPPKADPPLSVDADAVLRQSVTFQLFQSVRGGNAQVIERGRSVEHAELPKGGTLHIGPQSPDRLTVEKALGVSLLETLDHA